MKTRTLQQIYDFCLLDRSYNAYFDIPDDFTCTPKQYRYYHTPVHQSGITRAGTFIYSQAKRQLHRFMGIRGYGDECIRFHIDAGTYEIADRNQYDSIAGTLYIIACITKKGVQIRFTHPFRWLEEIIYDARSHSEYTPEGVRQDIIRYINKNLLFPPGRYRDLQIAYKVLKKDFAGWYKNYREKLQEQYDAEYWEMCEKYHPDTQNRIGFDECYSMLAVVGAFHDFGASDEYEREAMAEELMQMCNR